VHGIAGVTGGTLPAEIWHTYMTAALQGEAVQQFASPGTPSYKRWCGRYQFARTWKDARKGGCKHASHDKNHTTKKTTTTTHTTTRRNSPTTTAPPPPPTTTAPPPPTTTEPPPTTTTTTTTTTTPTTTTSGPP
jgi:membrane peptidoglycan carboxypeptidase